LKAEKKSLMTLTPPQNLRVQLFHHQHYTLEELLPKSYLWGLDIKSEQPKAHFEKKLFQQKEV
jgi:hypothetical protein